MKIIIAEDDPVSNHFIKKILEYWGHDIQSVIDGEQAWAAIEENGNPDLILSDWDMPNLTGVDLCKKIRNDPTKKDIYIILLTAKNLKTDMYNGFKMGADDFISKPVTEKELKESLEKGEKFLKDETKDREDLRRKNINNFVLRHQSIHQ
jgi:two-component system chemotaxis response regulator CheY